METVEQITWSGWNSAKTTNGNRNKLPGVGGIPPKLLMETVEQISIPLAKVFNLPLKMRIVPFIQKKHTSYHYFKMIQGISVGMTDQCV